MLMSESKPQSLLIIDDDQAIRRTLELHLNLQGYRVNTAANVEQGLQLAETEKPALIILDIRLPGQSGLEALPRFLALSSKPKVIMMTAFHDMETTITAMQNGAEDYIHKPIDIDELDQSISRTLKLRDNQDHLLQPQQDSMQSMVGRSRAMKEIFKTIGLVARTPATVLISGESGTGKELVARAIHQSSDHADGPFVAVNCAALVETLLESDMFGHEKGAFTGAVSRQAGKFEQASNGVIFLDEISEMSLSMQAKLLRVLQHKEYTPLGARTPLHSNARIIAASNVCLHDRVQSGEFREDLYYRLQVVNIHIPPLRERMEDLIDLVQTLMFRVNRELNRNVSHISDEVMECIKAYQWPGNIRELENVLMKAVAMCPGDTLTRELLPPELTSAIDAMKPIPQPDTTQFSSQLSLQQVEKQHVQQVLNSVDWHKGKACEILGVSRPRLRRLIQQYQLNQASEPDNAPPAA